MFWLGLLLVACGVFLLVYGTMLFRFAIAVAGFVVGFALGWWLLESASDTAQIIVAFALGGVLAIVGYSVVRLGVYLAGGLLGSLVALIVLSFLNIGSSVVNVVVVLAAAVAVGFFARSLGLWLTILATSAAGAYAIVYGLSRMFPDATQIRGSRVGEDTADGCGLHDIDPDVCHRLPLAMDPRPNTAPVREHRSRPGVGTAGRK